MSFYRDAGLHVAYTYFIAIQLTIVQYATIYFMILLSRIF